MTMQKKIKNALIYLVDDEYAIRDSLSLLFKSAGLAVKCYESAEKFSKDYDSEQPGCLILDILMPSMTGVELQEKLVEQGISIPIIFISGHGNVGLSTKVFRKGAMDFFEKPFDNGIFLERVKEALEKSYNDWEKTQKKKNLLIRYALLTNRERQVMQLVTNDYSNKEAARVLGISYRTVDIHRAKLMEKMQARSLTQLVVMAVSCGIIQNLETNYSKPVFLHLENVKKYKSLGSPTVIS
jgi:FixJ family two-component response regulator